MSGGHKDDGSHGTPGVVQQSRSPVIPVTIGGEPGIRVVAEMVGGLCI